MDSAPYELLAKIFKIYVSLQDPWPETKDPFPETLLNVCSWWRAVASVESTLWTKFVISYSQTVSFESEGPTGYRFTDYKLTRDWVGIFERRLERAGPSLPLQISILELNDALLPVIDVISGQAPSYVHLPRWETLYLRTSKLIDHFDEHITWGVIAALISQPMPSLKRLTLQQNKIDCYAFPDAPHLEELNILFSRSPYIGRNNSFPTLKKVKITYPGKYPLSLVELSRFSLRTIESLIIEGDVEVGGSRLRGEYPSLSTLEFTERVPSGIISMSAPNLRHLILRHPDLFTVEYPPPQHESYPSNREVLEMLGRTFPTVSVLDIHHSLINLVQGFLAGPRMFTNLKELWMVSGRDRERVHFDYF